MIGVKKDVADMLGEEEPRFIRQRLSCKEYEQHEA